MKFKILTLAVAVAALIGVDAKAQAFPPFTDPQGYLNVSDLVTSPSFAPGGFLFGTSYTVADQIALTSDQVSWELKPNTIAWATADADATTNGPAERIYWTNSSDGGTNSGPDGNKWMEALTYYYMDVVAGTTEVTFSVNVTSNSIDQTRYGIATVEPRIFIKVLDKVGGGWGVLLEDYTVIGAGTGSFTVDLVGLDNTLVGQEMQVGFVITGPNANPATDWGAIALTVTDLSLTSGDNVPPAPAPDFIAGNPFALSDSSMEMNSTTATDPAGVEYEFTNSTLNYSSGWQVDTNWIDLGPLGPNTTGDVDVAAAPAFVPLDGVWEGWNEPGGAVTPSSFVTVSAGVATVTPAIASERSFYTSYGVNETDRKALAINQDYEFTFTSDNVSATGAEAFVKAFNGGWGEDLAQFQTVALSGGGASQTISFTTDGGASVFYQIGFRTIGATTGSYDVSGIELLAKDLVQEGDPLGLTPSTTYDYQVRARDLTALTNTTPWSAISQGTTLAGDTNAPTPDPMTFAGPGDPSPQSVLMTATTASDASAVEYYFESVSGDGADSGWQSSPVYVDTGLASSSNFEYRVQARDLSLNQNTTAWSVTNISITTLSYPLSVSLANDLKGFTPGTSNEDLTVHSVLKADLEFEDYADLNRRVAFDASGAAFGTFSSGDGGRNILKTLANDYASADFEAFVTSTFSETDQNIFIGFGPGDLGAFGVPDWSPNGETTNASFIVQVFETAIEVWSQTNSSAIGFGNTTNAVLALATNTDQRIKLDYDAGAETCIVSLDTNYDGVTFTPDVVLGPIATPDFSLDETKVYLGGDDAVVLCDFEIIGGSAPVIGVTDLTISASGQLQWTSVLGQNYDVVYKNDLITEPTWTPDAANQNIPGTGGVILKTPGIAGDEVFYQVIAE